MDSMGLAKVKQKVDEKDNKGVNDPLVRVGPYLVLHEQNFFYKLWLFLYRFVKDLISSHKDTKFNDYGLSCFVGRQGSGKSMSMVVELERIRKYHPTVKIMTNFGYVHEDEPLTDWQQLIDCRNPDGIVFAIDEIQNEFDVYESRNFSLDILKVITQQRKQGIKVLASSQVFTRVSKPLREQCFEVIECYTLLGRWTFQKCFDADDYNYIIDSVDPIKKSKAHRHWRRNFVQSKAVRNLYDSYAVIESMKKLVRENQEKGIYK